MSSAPVTARSALWQAVTRFDRAELLPQIAVRNALGIALPLAVGVAIGDPGGGLVMTTGALNVSFSDGSDPYLHRGRRMLAASLCCALAVLAGGLSGRLPALVVLLAAGCAWLAGMMAAINQTVTDIGAVTLVTLVVFSSQAMTPERAVIAAGLAAGGRAAADRLRAGFLARPPLRPRAPRPRRVVFRSGARRGLRGARGRGAARQRAEHRRAVRALLPGRRPVARSRALPRPAEPGRAHPPCAAHAVPSPCPTGARGRRHRGGDPRSLDDSCVARALLHRRDPAGRRARRSASGMHRGAARPVGQPARFRPGRHGAGCAGSARCPGRPAPFRRRTGRPCHSPGRALFEKREAEASWRLRLEGALGRPASQSPPPVGGVPACRPALRLRRHRRNGRPYAASRPRLLGPHDHRDRAQAGFHFHVQPRASPPGGHPGWPGVRYGLFHFSTPRRPGGGLDRRFRGLAPLVRTGQLRRLRPPSPPWWSCCSPSSAPRRARWFGARPEHPVGRLPRAGRLWVWPTWERTRAAEALAG